MPVILDEDAERIAAIFASADPIDFATLTPQALRDMYDRQPDLPGPDVQEIRNLDIPGPLGPIPARLYRPSADPNLPLLVWYHGGGMVIGGLKQGEWISRFLCVEAGIAVLSVDYRLAPEHKFPAAVEDAYAAACWAHDNALLLGADPDFVSVGGDSAGGTCAAVACLLAKDRGGPHFCAQLLVYPGADRDLTRPSITEFADGPVLTLETMLWFRHQYHSDEAELHDLRASPSLAPSHAGLPPAFVITAEADPIRDAGENYAALLANAGVLTLRKRYNGVFHGFFTMGPLMAKTMEAASDAARFLRQVNVE